MLSRKQEVRRWLYGWDSGPCANNELLSVLCWWLDIRYGYVQNPRSGWCRASSFVYKAVAFKHSVSMPNLTQGHCFDLGEEENEGGIFPTFLMPFRDSTRNATRFDWWFATLLLAQSSEERVEIGMPLHASRNKLRESQLPKPQSLILTLA